MRRDQLICIWQEVKCPMLHDNAGDGELRSKLISHDTEVVGTLCQ